MRTTPADLTALARIRGAAIELFGTEGFGVGLRTIADRAGVSLGLIRHHYGSKHELRLACDTYVLDEIERLQAQKVETDNPAAALMENMTELDNYQPLIRYFLRALQSGGDLAQTFLARLIADSTTYVRRGEQNGMLKPSIDTEARARYLVMMTMGALLLEYALAPPGEDPALTWRRYADNATLPALEIYTHGLLADHSMFDAYLDYVKDPTSASRA